MIDYKSQQTSISLGIGNSTQQNIIQINSNGIELESAQISNGKILFPRQRMQIESKLDIPNDLIDIASIKKVLNWQIGGYSQHKIQMILDYRLMTLVLKVAHGLHQGYCGVVGLPLVKHQIGG